MSHRLSAKRFTLSLLESGDEAECIRQRSATLQENVTALYVIAFGLSSERNIKKR